MQNAILKMIAGVYKKKKKKQQLSIFWQFDFTNF